MEPWWKYQCSCSIAKLEHKGSEKQTRKWTTKVGLNELLIKDMVKQEYGYKIVLLLPKRFN